MRVCRRCAKDESQVRFYESNSITGKAAGACCQPCWVKKSVEWRRNNKDKWQLKSHKRAMLCKFGMTDKEYEHLYKNAKCAGCGATRGQHTSMSEKRLAVDHNHETGKIRGLLCHDCNRTIATAHDNPEVLRKLANYLTKREG